MPVSGASRLLSRHPRKDTPAMRHRKSWIVSHLLVAGIALLAASRAQAAIIGVPENLPPFGLGGANPEGQRGIYADMADAIAAHTQIPIQIKAMPYGRMLQELKTGGVEYAFGV